MRAWSFSTDAAVSPRTAPAGKGSIASPHNSRRDTRIRKFRCRFILALSQLHFLTSRSETACHQRNKLHCGKIVFKSSRIEGERQSRYPGGSWLARQRFRLCGGLSLRAARKSPGTSTVFINSKKSSQESGLLDKMTLPVTG